MCYNSPYMRRDHPRIPILTINELLHGKGPQMPPRYNPYRLAERRAKTGAQRAFWEQEAASG